MTTLRTDLRQWLIYDEPTIGALVRGLEVISLRWSGQVLGRHPLQPVRALGNLMLRIADARARGMMEKDGPERVVIEHLSKVMTFLAGQTDNLPAAELDELQATAFQADKRFDELGIQGPGFLREILRGD